MKTFDNEMAEKIARHFGLNKSELVERHGCK